MNAELNHNEMQRLTGLLADRAVQALSTTETDELVALLAHYANVDDTEFDEAASALHLAQPVLPEALPARLRECVVADAERFFGAVQVRAAANASSESRNQMTSAARSEMSARHKQNSSSPLKAAPLPQGPKQTAPVQTNNENPARLADVVAFPSSPKPVSRITTANFAKRSNLLNHLGWLAAAACFAVALMGGWKVREQQKQINALLATQANPNYAAQRQALLAQGSTVLRLNWAAASYPGMQSVQGDVVWSDTAQKGYMRFVGMPANDPNQVVYQLWIFAANQDEKYPIDGGIFNITDTGEVIVPINAKLQVSKPGLFAVTIEKPGGVVVSKRDKLALLAKVG